MTLAHVPLPLLFPLLIFSILPFLLYLNVPVVSRSIEAVRPSISRPPVYRLPHRPDTSLWQEALSQLPKQVQEQILTTDSPKDYRIILKENVKGVEAKETRTSQNDGP